MKLRACIGENTAYWKALKNKLQTNLHNLQKYEKSTQSNKKFEAFHKCSALHYQL